MSESYKILKALANLGGKAKPAEIYSEAFGITRLGRSCAEDFKRLRSEGFVSYNPKTIQYEITM